MFLILSLPFFLLCSLCKCQQEVIIENQTFTAYYCDSKYEPCGCSKNPAVLSRIVGGENADADTWGWIVQLSLPNDGLCGGTILSDSWIVTAAHCTYGSSASDINITAASLLLTQTDGVQIRTLSAIYQHPDYDNETVQNDISLLKLSSPLNMTSSALAKICLPKMTSTCYPPDGLTLVAIGWGRLSSASTYPASNELQQVTLISVPYADSRCRSTVSDTTTQLCAAAPGKDTCQGDSGGPLMFFSNSRWELVGIVSYGIGSCANASFAGVYTRVSAYLSWINVTMNGNVSKAATLFQNYELIVHDQSMVLKV
ncbi:unnamed protein product [Didymodactylos carnosus]|uniref:Peptidase S1 domain-containing protein n=1 Tax=Didymodactylos carnosus TaxID=1234261 RepID=A0A814TX50_9BILA|nr:unnamed protein product [Didymodactylos carnosus]CAF1168299.1 unnamed protein product [Didymodactylos carnosus]CAF3541110.1 unnamed protein product [Didymodactylos carnosus]CAF3931950.1 unnamed protein product [Didymodactylos carnosus]